MNNEELLDKYEMAVGDWAADLDVKNLERANEYREEVERRLAEVEALMALNAELEDAERIAWVMTVGRSLGFDMYVQHSVRNGVVSQWILDTPTNGKVLLNLCISKNPLSMPYLTQEARALIDAACEESCNG